jgi:hypothetical protein
MLSATAKKKKIVSSTGAMSNLTSHPNSQVQAAKKKVNLKDKTKGKSAGTEGNGKVLGGADYVSLMMGGRRKAKQEAGKLLNDE